MGRALVVGLPTTGITGSPEGRLPWLGAVRSELATGLGVTSVGDGDASLGDAEALVGEAVTSASAVPVRAPTITATRATVRAVWRVRCRTCPSHAGMACRDNRLNVSQVTSR